MRKTTKWIASQAYGLLTSFPQGNSRMKKRCLAALAACALVLFAVGCSSESEEEPSPLTVHNGTVYKCKADARRAVIPDGVTEISPNAFLNCSLLESVTIPESMAKISNGAFQGCVSLTSITIPDSVTTIEWNAFKTCTSLASIKIGKGVKGIEFELFSGCSSLTAIDLPDGIAYIRDNAFFGCRELVSVTIPRSVDTIGANAFGGCDKLTAVNYTGSSADWADINSGDVYQYPIETGLEGKTIVYDYGQEDSDD